MVLPGGKGRSQMPFQEELESKVAEINRLAKEMYAQDLEGQFGLWPDEDGVVDRSPRILPEQAAALSQGVDIPNEQMKYNYFIQTLSEVTARFELYYYLDSTEMPSLAARIGGLGDTSGGGSPYTTYDRIQCADDEWMRPVLKMIGADEWSGTAATTFHDDFLDPFHRAAERQMACTNVLCMAAMAAHRGVDAAQDDLLAIADAGIAAFRGDGETDVGTVLNVTSILAGLAGFLSGPGGVVANLVGLSIGIASQFIRTEDAPRKEWQVSGLTAPEILMSVWDSLMTFEEGVNGQDRQMADALRYDVDSRSCFASGGLRLPEPGTGGGFGRHTVGSVVPVPISEDEAVVTVVALKEAGSRNLPSAAHQYEQAASHLSAAIPTSFSRLLPQTASAFEQARAALRAVVDGIRSDLETAGVDLVEVAESYPTTDEQNAEIVRQTGLLLPPVLEDAPDYPAYY
jgi:hypothetical protein